MKYYNVICFDPNTKAFVKYRNVTRLDKFEIFAKNKGYKYANVYDKSTRIFSHQIKLK